MIIKKLFLISLLLNLKSINSMSNNWTNIYHPKLEYFHVDMFLNEEFKIKTKQEIEHRIKKKENLNKKVLLGLSFDREIIYRYITPINFAIENNDINLLKLLLENKANPNWYPDETSWSYLELPLWKAATLLNINAIKLLISYKANPNIIIDKTSPLIAVLTGAYPENEKQYKIIKLLLEFGANPNLLVPNYNNYTNKTALTKSIEILNLFKSDAKEYKHMKSIIKLLLLYGADPNLKANKKEKITAIEYAQNCKLDDIVKILKEYKDMRTKTISILLSHAIPKLPKDMIELIINLSV